MTRSKPTSRSNSPTTTVPIRRPLATASLTQTPFPQARAATAACSEPMPAKCTPNPPQPEYPLALPAATRAPFETEAEHYLARYRAPPPSSAKLTKSPASAVTQDPDPAAAPHPRAAEPTPRVRLHVRQPGSFEWFACPQLARHSCHRLALSRRIEGPVAGMVRRRVCKPFKAAVG